MDIQPSCEQKSYHTCVISKALAARAPVHCYGLQFVRFLLER